MASPCKLHGVEGFAPQGMCSPMDVCLQMFDLCFFFRVYSSTCFAFTCWAITWLRCSNV